MIGIIICTAILIGMYLLGWYDRKAIEKFDRSCERLERAAWKLGQRGKQLPPRESHD